jgi:hypothetical protein
MTDDPVATAARAVATRLGNQHGPGLAAEVEAALHARGAEQRREQYIDPVSLGSLIVGIASLAWSVYTTLRQKTPKPSPDVVTRSVRVELRNRGDETPDHITDVVVTEIIRAVGDSET